MEPVLSTAQVAALLGKSTDTVRAWVRRGILSGSRPGGRELLFYVSDVEAAIARSRTQPRQPESPRPAQRQAGRSAGDAPAQPGLTIREEFWRRRHEREARLGAGRIDADLGGHTRAESSSRRKRSARPS